MEETNAAVIVDAITKNWLGAVGGVLAVLGVIAAPITSGDYGFSVRAAYRCGLSGYGTKVHSQSFIYMCADVFGCYRIAAVQPARLKTVLT